MSRQYNVIDSDGHVCEPPDLWQRYIEPKYRDQAPYLTVAADGRQRFVFEGKPVGSPTGAVRAGSVGMPREDIDKMNYTDGRKGGFDPHERIKDLDLDGIDAVFLYPSMGLFSGVIENPDLAAAVCRAYNRWIVDFCKPYPDRLFPVAMLPMQSVEHVLGEMKFARENLGIRAAFLRPNPYNNKLLSDPVYYPVWQQAQELDVSLGFHEGTGGMATVAIDRVPDYTAKHIVSHTMEMMLAALNIIWGGVCERYPGVRFGFLECGGGWMPSWLDRMDRHFASKSDHHNEANVRIPPSEYFKRQCWISFEPPEGTIASSAEYLGANRLLWATDYPHYDGFFPGAPRMIADKLPPGIRRQVMAQGAMDFYKLS